MKAFYCLNVEVVEKSLKASSANVYLKLNTLVKYINSEELEKSLPKLHRYV